jgi:hypothetical protein
MSSRITAQRRVKAIAQGTKVQNTNSRVNTNFLYRGALGCGPISYSEINYVVPKCIPQCIIIEPCLTASILDGGVPSYVGFHVLDGGTPFQSGICIYDGGIVVPPTCLTGSVFDGGSPTSSPTFLLSGGTPQQAGYCQYDGGYALLYLTGGSPSTSGVSYSGGTPSGSGPIVYSGGVP